MRKKFLFVVLTIVMVACVAFTFAACNNNRPSDGDFEMPVGTKPNLSPRITEEESAIISAALDADATADERIAAVMTLYNIANSSRIMSNTSLMVQESRMGILPAGVDENTTLDDDMLAKALMHGFTLKDGDEFFNQFSSNVTDVVEGMDFMISIMNGLGSMMLKQSYRDAEGNLYFCIDKSDKTETECRVNVFPYAQFKQIVKPEKMDEATFLDKTNTLTAPCEIYNMKFVPEIIADDATITYDEAAGLYHVTFQIDMSADAELLKEWYALPYKDMQEGGQDIENYAYYRANFDVWDNGYVKSYYAIYARNAGMGSGVTEDNFSYLYNKDEILDIISTDYRLTELEAEEMKEQGDLKAFLTFYETSEVVKAGISKFTIFIIVASIIGAVVLGAIIAAIVVAVRYKKGHYPKLHAKAEARKQAKLAKKYGGALPEGTEQLPEEAEQTAEEPEQVSEEVPEEVGQGEEETPEE